MAIGAITVNNTGSLTEPSKLLVSLGSVLSAPRFCGWGPFNTMTEHGLRAVCVANGIDFQYHFIDGVGYLTGPRAPANAAAVSSTAVRATSVLTFGTNAQNNNQILVGFPTGARYITFVTTLDVSPTGRDQVLIGANLAATITNLVALI